MVEILFLLLQQLLLLNSNHNHGGDDRDSEERCAKLQTKKVQLMKFAKAAAQKVKKNYKSFLHKVIFASWGGKNI